MKKRKVFWILAGTTEGRKLARILSGCDVLIHLSLATEYGKWFIDQKDNILVHAQRLNKEEMVSFIREKEVDCVIDTTHPYAREATKNISAACRETGTEYIRLLRPPGAGGDFIYAGDTGQAAEILAGTPGRVFLACGGKEIGSYTVIPDFAERVFLRVLPDPETLRKCIGLGFKPHHIICMQGPFSTELNAAMLRATGAEILVTKDSGDAGGFKEKIEAAGMLGVKVVVIGRPPENEGLDFQHVVDKLRKEHGLPLIAERKTKMTGILVLAHGSRKKETEGTLDSIVGVLKEELGMENIEKAFLQFSGNSLREGLLRLMDRGVKDIKVVPYFLFAGVHIKEDIPLKIREFQAEYPEVKISLGGTLGADRRLAAVLADRVRELL